MNLTIYTTPTCVYCKMAKEFFTSNNINYQEINVAADQAAARTMVQKSGQLGVPVITVEKDGKEEIIIGFDRPRLSQLLDIK
ncbi:MAG: glutaredoxin family protein [Candidatus Buchananbacteria bacterium]|nr:glutaredoxin family protein [Candidatus Buchananbacteria bacterium]